MCSSDLNPLQLRAQETYSDEENERRLAEAIQNGKAMLDREKMRRDAMQIGVQWRMLEQRGPGTRDFSDMLVRIERMAEGIKRRAPATEFSAACEWCESLIDSVHAISIKAGRGEAGCADPSGDFMPLINLVGHATQALLQIFSPGNDTAPCLVDIDSQANRVLARIAAA